MSPILKRIFFLVSIDSPLFQVTTAKNSARISAEPSKNKAILDVVHPNTEHDADLGVEQDADPILSAPLTPLASGDGADLGLDPAIAQETSCGSLCLLATCQDLPLELDLLHCHTMIPCCHWILLMLLCPWVLCHPDHLCLHHLQPLLWLSIPPPDFNMVFESQKHRLMGL
jgi:hypothetical protein